MLRKGLMIGEHLGWSWVFFRLRYRVKLRSRWLERACPVTSWDAVTLPAEGVPLGERPFFFGAADFLEWRGDLASLDKETGSGPDELARKIGQGSFRFYSWDEKALGFPPQWNANAYTGEVVPADLHWSRLSDFGYGDIKHVWELSRFAWVYPLVRAFARNGEKSHQETFEVLLGNWLAENPPNLGPQWKCGQEVAIRVMAILWGWFGLGRSEALKGSIRRLAWISGKRIEANIEYALQQYNNHGLSEAAGLWTIGLLFPEFAESVRWKALGRALLGEQASTLIYEDGGCSQSSFNYERVMLDVLIWSVRLGQIYEEPLGESVLEAIGNAADLLWQCQDEVTGRVPNYGANDGAHVLPLTNANYLDFRPVLQAATMLVHGKRRYKTGPHDEGLLWLFGVESLEAPLLSANRTDFRADVSGYYTLRNPQGFLFMRCGAYRHRPSHADQLHVDLWWRGENVLRDSGTYSYNADKPFDEGFKNTRFHNTVVVDGRDQMDKASRFLWLPWVKGRMAAQEQAGVLVGKHDGYQRLSDPVTHVRKVERIGDHGFLVVDRLNGAREPHTYEIRWHLAPGFTQHTDGGARLNQGETTFYVQLWNAEVVRWTQATDEAAEGWSSPYYTNKLAGNVLSGHATRESAVFVTWLGEVQATSFSDAENGEITVVVDDKNMIVPLDGVAA